MAHGSIIARRRAAPGKQREHQTEERFFADALAHRHILRRLACSCMCPVARTDTVSTDAVKPCVHARV